MQDVIIIGGGMIGAATALGLAKLGLNVVVVEKNPLPTFSPEAPYDVRISAISHSSVALLERLGAWEAISQMRVCPYDGLETWEIEGFKTSFHARDLGLDKLGFMVENNVLQIGLWQALSAYPNCTQAVGVGILSANREGEMWTITLDDKRVFSAPLVLACDGANSLARRWAYIGLTLWDYRHSCLLAVVETEKPQQSVTWQKFFTSGPRAFLPLCGHQGCVVWYDSPERIAELKSLNAEKLSAEIEANFPARLGRVRVSKFGSFPLTRQHAQRYVRNGVALLGDAAHTINPLAGQGVNLGFKDVATLLDLAEQAVKKGEHIANPTWLKAYENQRKPDNLVMQTAMDLFYKAFKTELLPVKVARTFALVMAERATPLKKKALEYALGLK